MLFCVQKAVETIETSIRPALIQQHSEADVVTQWGIPCGIKDILKNILQ